jgi:hypothetical protein
MKRGGQEENQQIQNGQPYTTRQNLGCYHAASGSLNWRKVGPLEKIASRHL